MNLAGLRLSCGEQVARGPSSIKSLGAALCRVRLVKISGLRFGRVGRVWGRLPRRKAAKARGGLVGRRRATAPIHSS